MSSVMVVVPEPAVKGGGAFGAGAVDGGVGPACEKGADEALGFAVCLGSVGAGAAVLDAECAAGERVDGGAVAGAVVGEDPLDLDAVSVVVGDGATEEAGSGRGFLVGEDLGVGEAAVVVDGDVDVLPALVVAAAVVAAAGDAAGDAVAGPGDPAELLDVDMDELPGLERS